MKPVPAEPPQEGPKPDKAIRVKLIADGSVLFDGQPGTQAEVVARVVKAYKPGSLVIIDVHPKVMWKHAADLWGALAEAGVKDLAFGDPGQ